MVTTFRRYYDAAVAVGLMSFVAIACGFIAAVITGDSSPSVPVAIIAPTAIFFALCLWQDFRRPFPHMLAPAFGGVPTDRNVR